MHAAEATLRCCSELRLCAELGYLMSTACAAVGTAFASTSLVLQSRSEQPAAAQAAEAAQQQQQQEQQQQDAACALDGQRSGSDATASCGEAK